MRKMTLKSKWYWFSGEPIEVQVRQGVVGDYWLIPELNLTVTGLELFDTKEDLFAYRYGPKENTQLKEEQSTENTVGRATWVSYLRVIDGKKK